jgi:hypothetical protein
MSDDTVERIQSATRIFRQIQALARSDYGGNTNALLVVYAVEGFLRRLATSQYADKMTLEGGMLMAAMSARRITKDADLSTVGVGNSEAIVAAAVAEIVANKLDVEDGLAFDADSIRTEVMREDAEYHGVRVKLIAHLVTAKITTTLDFAFGDPHRSTVIELPELLGIGTIRLASYPPEMSLAEKVATMMSRRELNTRDRDFADTWILSRVHCFRASELRSAIVDVAAHRNHEVVTLAAALADMPDRQQTYTAMLGRMAYQRMPPASWRELLDEIRGFIDPLIEDATRQLSKWDPATQTWTSADNSGPSASDWSRSQTSTSQTSSPARQAISSHALHGEKLLARGWHATSAGDRQGGCRDPRSGACCVWRESPCGHSRRRRSERRGSPQYGRHAAATLQSCRRRRRPHGQRAARGRRDPRPAACRTPAPSSCADAHFQAAPAPSAPRRR